MTRGLTPLVGRESEVTLLQERWAQAKSGQGHVVLLSGDAGIGKSRLVQMLKDHVANEPHVRWECRSLSYLGLQPQTADNGTCCIIRHLRLQPHAVRFDRKEAYQQRPVYGINWQA